MHQELIIRVFSLTVLFLCNKSVYGEVDVSACGSTKGCLLSPTDCQGTGCSFIATWAAAGPDKVKFELQGNEDWVAIAFSKDQTMGDDSVVECVKVAAGNVVVQSTYNKPAKGTFEYFEQEALSEASGSFSGLLSCSFERSITSDNENIFPLNEAHYVMVGGGPVINDAKSFHNSYPQISSAQIDVSTDVAGAKSAEVKTTLVRAHGLLMMTAWTIFVCTAIMLARYFKTGWPEKKLLDKMPVWFSLHRIFNTTVMILTVIAFVLIFIDVKGYSQNTTTSAAKAHPIIGIIVTFLAITNPVMALFRPHPGTENRCLFDYAHWTVGTTASILAVVNTYLGMTLSKSSLFVADWLKYVLVCFALLYAVVVLVLEADRWRTGSQGNKPDKKEPMFRYIVFYIYLVCAVILWLVMLIVMLM